MFARHVVVLSILSCLAGTAAAAGGGGEPPGARSGEVRKAEQLIRAKKWDEAVKVLERAAERDDRNADIYNWLGYAERNRGNTDAAFSYYDKALAIDPKHRGAHEYVGEAYLIVGNVEKAKEHLAALKSLCGTKCEEYEDLRDAIGKWEKNQAHGGGGM
jgi:tetratricopeptide (TPR) repeat protein